MADQWQLPKKFATSKDVPKDKETETRNRFSSLPVDDVATEPFKKATKKMAINHIPPILVDLLGGEWTHQNITGVIEKYEKGFHLQFKGRNRVKVQCYSAKGHQLVKEGLLKEKVVFHTFSRKDEKLPKAVLKGLPKHLQETLPAELASIGFAGATITEIKTMYPAECPPLLIQLPSGTDMAKFKQIKYLSSCVVDIEKYKPNNKTGTQCFRCQGFGHSSRNCNRPARCVKCALAHPTWECQKKDREKPARCCNCQQDHPANYAQCTERLKYLQRIQSKREAMRKTTILKAETAPITMTAPRPDSWANIAKSKIDRLQGFEPTTTAFHKPEARIPEGEHTKPLKSKLVTQQAQQTSTDAAPVEQFHTQDFATTEMLEILNTIHSIKQEFTKCKTFMEKVILVLTHLGHYV